MGFICFHSDNFLRLSVRLGARNRSLTGMMSQDGLLVSTRFTVVTDQKKKVCFGLIFSFLIIIPNPSNNQINSSQSKRGVGLFNKRERDNEVRDFSKIIIIKNPETI